jgi:hypothetical protein
MKHVDGRRRRLLHRHRRRNPEHAQHRASQRHAKRSQIHRLEHASTPRQASAGQDDWTGGALRHQHGFDQDRDRHGRDNDRRRKRLDRA